MKTILVPLDLSKASARIVAAAAQLASLVKARLVLLHANEPPVVMNDIVALDAIMVADLTAQSETLTKRRIAALAAKLGKTCKVETLSVRGRPRDVVLREARRLKADYIVIGSHGHTAAYDLLIGSTTQAVLRNARCPVLVIPVRSSR